MTDSYIGTPGRIRTYDLWLRKPTLYPAELRVLVVAYALVLFCLNGKSFDLQATVLLSKLHSVASLLGLQFCVTAKTTGVILA